VNSGVPKTLVRFLVGWVAANEATDDERAVLREILDTPVSPELLPPDASGGIAQKTEDVLGPYEVHDFYLFCLLRLGAGPKKSLFLAEHAFAGRHAPESLKAWLRTFLTRFFSRAEGRIGEPLPARRLAHAVRRERGRVARRAGVIDFSFHACFRP
jgi:NAD+ synthase (glutamine-hydrolysing)